jgi:cystathionine beta-lyase
MPPRKPSTELIDHPYRPPGGFESPQPPVHKASTVFFPDTTALRNRQWKDKSGYTYGLHGTPTTFTLEERIATLEGGTDCLLVGSGLAAIALVNASLLKSGDEVLLPANVYGPSRELAQHELAQWGIAHRLYDPMDVAAFEAMLTPATALVWLEAPGSVTMEFPDLAGLLRVCRARGIATALDNTWGAGLAFCGFDLDGQGLGADIVMQALTKYPSGGGDVLMGSLVTRDRALHLRLKMTHMRLGLHVAGNDTELVLRSLPTLPLRYAEQDRSARVLAQWLASRPEVAEVRHPALPAAPGHAHWAALCTQAAGLFSITFAAGITPAQGRAFVDALRRFRIGYSWGGPVSLAVPYEYPPRAGLPQGGHLVRLAIGLEDTEDLRADLEQALAVLAG